MRGVVTCYLDDLGRGTRCGVSGFFVDSHLAGCAGAGPGRRCAGSPCLSRCSPSARGSPPDCPKPATPPLNKRTGVSFTLEPQAQHTHEHVRQSLQTFQRHKTPTPNSSRPGNEEQAPHDRSHDTETERLKPEYLLHRPNMQQNQRDSGTWRQYNIRGKSLQNISEEDE